MTVRPRRYTVVDAFSSEPLMGNPVAVVLDAEELSGEQMQGIARWINLSETTFLLPATVEGADYRLRIFTPKSELPFAGHPTLGSAHAVLEAGRMPAGKTVLVQQCGQGLVPIAVKGDGANRRLILDLPSATITPLPAADIARLEAIIGVSLAGLPAPSIVDVGAVWIVAQVPDAEAVLSARPDLAMLAGFDQGLGATGLTIFGAYAEESAAQIEVRSFAPSCGVDEDPVCGSGNGSVAVFRRHHGQLPMPYNRYVATQGRCVGRDGIVEISVTHDGAVTVGGACVTCVDGTLYA